MSSEKLFSVFQNDNFTFWIKLFIVLLNIFGYLYASHQKFTYIYSVMRLNEIIFQFVDMLADALLNLSNTINAINGLANLKFFMLIAQYNRQFERHDLLKSHFKMIILIHFLATITGVVNLLYMVNVDVKMVTYAVYKLIEFICFNIAVSVFFWCGQEINTSLKNFNNSIEVKGKLESKANIIIVELNIRRTYQNFLKNFDTIVKWTNLTRKHNKICEILDEINLRFKSPVAITLIAVTMTVLWSIMMVIKYGFQDESGNIFGLSRWMTVLWFSFVSTSVFVCFTILAYILFILLFTRNIMSL